MLPMKLMCEVMPNGSVTLQLPFRIAPGPHEIVVVIDESTRVAPESSQGEFLSQFAGAWQNRGMDEEKESYECDSRNLS